MFHRSKKYNVGEYCQSLCIKLLSERLLKTVEQSLIRARAGNLGDQNNVIMK